MSGAESADPGYSLVALAACSVAGHGASGSVICDRINHALCDPDTTAVAVILPAVRGQPIAFCDIYEHLYILGWLKILGQRTLAGMEITCGIHYVRFTETNIV